MTLVFCTSPLPANAGDANVGITRVRRSPRREAQDHGVSCVFRASARGIQGAGGRAMYKQVLDPVGNALGWSSLLAAMPLIVLFVLLGGVRMKAQWAALLALLTAILVALIAYDMPVGQTMDSAAEGAIFGFFPIMWIVVNAIWVYNMTRETGHFAVLRRSFATVSPDERIQAVIIAFCFGALIEALAGFGTPVAISSVMLIALGFRPIKAAAVSLVANTAPVAFGAIAIPIVTLSQVSGLPKDDLGAMV